MSLTIVYPLSMEWDDDGAKHTVQWTFRGGQREAAIEAIFKAIKEVDADTARNRFESMRDMNPDLALTCPTCLRNKPKKNRKAKR